MTRRDHILASYAILVAALGVVLVVLLRAPIAQRLEFAAELERARETYVRAERALARSATLERNLSDWSARSNVARYLHNAPTAALAGAELQNHLHVVAEAAGAVLVSSASRHGPTDGPLEPITVSVRLRCSVEALLAILHGLEGREPTLFVDNLVVQSRYRGGRILRDPTDQLDVELEVSGYVDSGGAP